MISKPFWLSEDSLGFDQLQQYPTLASKETADVCIVGGGIVGTFIAYWLSEHNISVILLEKDVIAGAASGRNTGFILPGTVEHFNRAVSLYGKDKALSIWRFTEKNYKQILDISQEEKIDYDIQENGSLILAGSEQEHKELKESIALLSQAQVQAEWMPKSFVEEQMGTPQLFGAIKTKIGAGIQPVKLVNALSSVNQKRGISIFEKSSVIDIKEYESNSIQIITEQGSVDCSMAIVSANAYTSQILNSFSELIFPFQGQAFVTDPIPTRLFNEVIYANFGFEYWRQLKDGRLMVGGFREKDPKKGEGFSTEINIELIHGLYDYFNQLFPQAGQPSISHYWAGTMGFSQDGLPIVGNTHMPHCFVCGGFTGHGLGFASAIGELTANLIVNGKADDSNLFHISRFN